MYLALLPYSPRFTDTPLKAMRSSAPRYLVNEGDYLGLKIDDQASAEEKRLKKGVFRGGFNTSTKMDN